MPAFMYACGAHACSTMPGKRSAVPGHARVALLIFISKGRACREGGEGGLQINAPLVLSFRKRNLRSFSLISSDMLQTLMSA